MRLSLLQRIGLLILAMLPVAWGNCPGWFDGRGACADPVAAGATGDAQPHSLCPCCAKRSREGRPLRGCDECPIVAVRRTASQVPPMVVLPPPALIGLATLLRLDAVGDADVLAPPIGEPRPRCGPPDLVGTVVLLV